MVKRQWVLRRDKGRLNRAFLPENYVGLPDLHLRILLQAQTLKLLLQLQ